MKKKLIFLIVLSVGFTGLRAQLSSGIREMNIHTALDSTYLAFAGSSSLLYNGPEYYYNENQFTGHVFLASPGFDNNGSIVYDGMRYNRVPLAYDILRDELVTLSYDRNFQVKVLPGKLKEFTIGRRRFLNLDMFRADINRIGYFEVLTDGRVLLLAKRIKKLKENTSGQKVVYDIVSDNTYFIVTGNELAPVSDRSSLLAHFNDKRNELSAFIDNEGLSFRIDIETALKRVINYYEKIAPTP